MKRPRQPTEPELQVVCMKWNASHRIGAKVEYHPVIGQPKHQITKTRSGAFVLSGHTAVIFVEGVSGCVALEAVNPIKR